VLDCGNAGTSARLLLGLLAGLPGFTVMTGDATLRRRPMGRVVEPLRAMGARIDGCAGGERLPLAIRGGALHGVDIETRQASAQVKGAILLAGLRARGRVAVVEPAPSRDHTERMLTACGVAVRRNGARVEMDGCQEIRAPGGGFVVAGDPSAAAFFLVAAALLGTGDLLVPGVLTNATRAGAFAVMERMGARVRHENPLVLGGEPVADLRVDPGPLRATMVGGGEVPTLIDEIPILAVLAARARGTTVFSDATELRAKESDRVRSTVAMLRALGVVAEERPDGLVVTGDPDRPFRAGTVRSEGDHRIAMSAAVAALCADGPVTILGTVAVNTSFPDFFSRLEGLRGSSDRRRD
jgi:3-phosphoshikimate 1-carboxyvinyltransferase